LILRGVPDRLRRDHRPRLVRRHRARAGHPVRRLCREGLLAQVSRKYLHRVTARSG